MSMQGTVDSFNSLLRPELSPSGHVSNHWYFAIRHVPLHPAGDLVQLTNPASRFIAMSDSEQILSKPTIAAQAGVIVPLILNMFIKGLDRGPDGRPTGGFPPIAPFSWGTRNSDLARAVEKTLRTLGVREDLCTVQPGTKEQDEISDEIWDETAKMMLAAVSSDLSEQASPGRANCACCRKDSSWFSAGLMKCAGCNKTSYCSRKCQKIDWKQHKKTCGITHSDVSRASLIDEISPMLGQVEPFIYYHKVAHMIPEAKALARSINLPLPPTSGGLSKPIRALVITGKDTPYNFELLLGPKWRSESSMWDEARIDILLEAPVGSPSYAVNYLIDRSVVSSPRPASSEEMARVQTVRAMQQAIRTRLGARREPTSQDIMPVLMTFGGDWATMLPTYQLAVNTMDQGVRAN